MQSVRLFLGHSEYRHVTAKPGPRHCFGLRSPRGTRLHNQRHSYNCLWASARAGRAPIFGTWRSKEGSTLAFDQLSLSFLAKAARAPNKDRQRELGKGLLAYRCVLSILMTVRIAAWHFNCNRLPAPFLLLRVSTTKVTCAITKQTSKVPKPSPHVLLVNCLRPNRIWLHENRSPIAAPPHAKRTNQPLEDKSNDQTTKAARVVVSLRSDSALIIARHPQPNCLPATRRRKTSDNLTIKIAEQS
jgi:hypothetical protein